ncbi:MAG: dienelactone hydrolase family protein [Thermomicrobiales bacterium]|nr:dienelactone hydrolase family protein [Thermomicrobiales bacterium]
MVTGHPHKRTDSTDRVVSLPVDSVILQGNLVVPPAARGVILFAHGSGSSRHSPRNRYVAGVLQEAGFATLLIDLLTSEEETIDDVTRHLRFDIPLLAQRLTGGVDWLTTQKPLRDLPIGLFGASTGAAAALLAAVARPNAVRAVVSRGGRPDLAGSALPLVEAPTLFIVGGHDEEVIELNEQAKARLTCPRRLTIVPGATHLFEEPGTLEQVAGLAAEWFAQRLVPAAVGSLSRDVTSES